MQRYIWSCGAKIKSNELSNQNDSIKSKREISFWPSLSACHQIDYEFMRIFKNGCPSSHQHQCTFQMFFCVAPLLNAQCSRRRAHTLCINATTRAAISHFLRLIVVVVVVIFCRRLYELEEFLANYHAQTKQSNTTVYGIANKCHHKLHVIFFFCCSPQNGTHACFYHVLWSKRDRVE